MIKRCDWAEGHELLKDYHDNEWGVPVYDDQKLFECLTLEGAQAGLSWLTVLKKRKDYQEAFLNFNIEKVAAFTAEQQEGLVHYPNLIQNKLKLQSVSHNAKCIQTLQEEYGSFSSYIWSFVEHKPIINQWTLNENVPSKDEISESLSRSLKTRGFKFIGPTICYSFMQATGMVNDHLVDCLKFGSLLEINGNL